MLNLLFKGYACKGEHDQNCLAEFHLEMIAGTIQEKILLHNRYIKAGVRSISRLGCVLCFNTYTNNLA